MDHKKLSSSEARILVYINVVEPENRYNARMSLKLDLNRPYVNELLFRLVEKGYLTKKRSGQRVLYFLTEKAPLDQAMALLSKDKQNPKTKGGDDEKDNHKPI